MKTKLLYAYLIAVVALTGLSCGGLTTADTSPSGGDVTTAAPVTPAAVGLQWGHRTKTSDCVPVNAEPDLACTPGDILTTATKDQVCTPGYSSQTRDVPNSVKEAVYEEYGITHHTTGEYEVDHDVSLELGGSNDISNLWPEAANPTPGFHQKDKVEDYLHTQVCNGSLTLAEAQHEIATDWLAVYNQLPNK